MHKQHPYKQYLLTFEALAENTLEQNGFELVDVELKTSEGKPHLVIYIDNNEGVSLEHCQQVSKILGEMLDREDPLPGSYYLEVSSPGIERRLKKPRDFIRFLGKDIKVKTFNKIDGSKNFRGTLQDFRDNTLTILLDNGEEKEFALEDVHKANLWYKHEPRR